MESLKAVAKAPPFLPTKKIKDLEINKKYKISKHKKVQTKFGAKMVLELDGSFDVFLPTKVIAFLIENNTDEEKLKNEIDTRDVYLVHYGHNIIEFM
ncbi:uncharacterized protein LOC116415891 isoform X2 [Nasonia vitripennis]|uniref:Uncharacterized protein n=1 Tax=Nasonia vitripennis TaxID=7425 RepID=A0A7M7PUZ1_NASVI|nr:uncharacterized protein LOC116415891 isoform X2 [Nasonia vitripennis]